MAYVQFEVPDKWVAAADERNLSLKEYCHRMIRAGRRQYGADYAVSESPADPQTLKLDDTDSKTKIDDTLKEWVLQNLSTDDAQDVDDLVNLLEKDIAKLGDELCDEGKAKYRRNAGGYIKITDE